MKPQRAPHFFPARLPPRPLGILDSVKSTCCRTMGSYFIKASLCAMLVRFLAQGKWGQGWKEARGALAAGEGKASGCHKDALLGGVKVTRVGAANQLNQNALALCHGENSELKLIYKMFHACSQNVVARGS